MEWGLIIVTGDKIITPGAIVQLVFLARLATAEDFTEKKEGSTMDTSSDESDIDEDDVDILIGRKRSHNDGEPVAIPLAHAPYFPIVRLLPPFSTHSDSFRNTNLDGGLSLLTRAGIESSFTQP